jgi:hypothetical protein
MKPVPRDQEVRLTKGCLGKRLTQGRRIAHPRENCYLRHGSARGDFKQGAIGSAMRDASIRAALR